VPAVGLRPHRLQARPWRCLRRAGAEGALSGSAGASAGGGSAGRGSGGAESGFLACVEQKSMPGSGMAAHGTAELC